MYYAETLIDGVLYCRHSPDGVWKKVTRESLSERVVKAEAMVKQLKDLITQAAFVFADNQ